MNQLDIEGRVRRRYYRTYIYCICIIVAGLIIFLYGIQSLPQAIPIDNKDSIQYQLTTSSEQQAADLRNYQIGTSQFKIAISGVGIFIFGVCLGIYYSYRANQEIELSYETEQRRNNERAIRNLPLQQQQEPKQQQQEPKQQQQENKVTFSQAPKLTVAIPIRPPPTAKFSYYPPNYRNAMLRIYPEN